MRPRRLAGDRPPRHRGLLGPLRRRDDHRRHHRHQTSAAYGRPTRAPRGLERPLGRHRPPPQDLHLTVRCSRAAPTGWPRSPSRRWMARSPSGRPGHRVRRGDRHCGGEGGLPRLHPRQVVTARWLNPSAAGSTASRGTPDAPAGAHPLIPTSGQRMRTFPGQRSMRHQHRPKPFPVTAQLIVTPPARHWPPTASLTHP